MKKIFDALFHELEASRPAVLCTIVASRGSTPREAGAKMLVLEGGRTLGTIGGGEVELQAARRAARLLEERRSGAESYRLSAEGSLGMACGGEVEILFQYFAPEDVEKARALASEEETRVFLFGGGHVARALSQALALAEFSVEVWDDRPGMATKERFPDAAACRCGPYPGALEVLPAMTEEDFVVVMTHGHQADFEVLSQVLGTPVKYIGCIGSKGKAAAVRERLSAAGFMEADIRRIYSPIGLPIGGKSPGEIAISVAAQLIACRSGRLEDFR